MSQPLSPLDRYAPGPPPLPLPSHPLVQEVMDGTRYVTHPYVVSLLLISFNRSLGGVLRIGSDSWPIGNLFSATLITLFFGWWGFPWGIIWTPLSLFYLWRGGRDCTMGLLTEAVGPNEAQRVMAAAPKPKAPPTIWLVRLMILAPVALFVLFVSAVVSSEA